MIKAIILRWFAWALLTELEAKSRTAFCTMKLPKTLLKRLTKAQRRLVHSNNYIQCYGDLKLLRSQLEDRMTNV